MFQNVMAIAFGAALGALSRWLLVLAFAALSVPFSVGTLAANWIGAFLIGICAEWLDNPQWKLLLITGFLGSLTTFSSFSLEMVTLMQAQRWATAFSAVCLHVFGSFLLTALGIYFAQSWK